MQTLEIPQAHNAASIAIARDQPTAAPWWAVKVQKDVETCIAECLVAKREANRRDRYCAELERVLTNFAKGSKNVPIASISPADLEEFLRGCGKSAASRSTAISRLGALFGFCEKRGYIEHNPVRRLDNVPIERRPPRILTPAEAELLLRFTQKRDPEMLPYIVLGMFAGIRPAELDRLEWACIDMAGGFVRIDAAASKVRRRRLAKLEPAAIAWLKVVRTKTIAVDGNKSRRLQRLGRCLGWKGWHHDIL